MKKTFKIQGMHCRSCEVLISEGLKELGISDFKVQPGFVEIEFDEKLINEKKIIQRIEDDGFKVRK